MFQKRHPPAGAQPGTLILAEESCLPRIRVIRYSESSIQELDDVDIDTLPSLLSEDTTCWVDVQGLGDEATLRGLAKIFGIHPLALEDLVNIPQRPKVEQYDLHTLCIARMAHTVDGELQELEQVSLLIGDNYLLTIQEHSGDLFDPVRSRIRRGRPVIRRSGPAYLAYAILDAVIDGYYPAIESLGEKLESLEKQILEIPDSNNLQEILDSKRTLLELRKTIWPQREVVHKLLREEFSQFDESIMIYLQDCKDHCDQLADVLEVFREMTSGLMDTYYSTISNQQNEIMRILTVVASIFIPLTFLAGIYGMNFKKMPELDKPWGYPVLLILMSCVAIVMIVYFYRKRWLFRPSRKS